MKYMAFAGTAGLMPPEALAVMNRDLPAYLEEMDRRGARLLVASWISRRRRL